MGRHRIVCIKTHLFHHPHPHSHVVRVATGTPQQRDRVWTIAEVYAAMEIGDSFYTSPEGKARAEPVIKTHCQLCGTDTLCSAPGVSSDVDVTSLPEIEKT